MAPSGVLGQVAESHTFLLPRTLETSDLESRTGDGAAKTLMAGREEGDLKPWEETISAYDTLGSTMVPDLGTGRHGGGRVLQTGLPLPCSPGHQPPSRKSTGPLLRCLEMLSLLAFRTRSCNCVHIHGRHMREERDVV